MNCLRSQLKVISRPGGSILNCSSGAGLGGLPHHGAYGASKWRIRGLTKTAAVEYGPEEIWVNCLIPYVRSNPWILDCGSSALTALSCPSGGIDSSPMLHELAAKGLLDLQWMADHSGMRRMGKPDEVAKMAAFLHCPDDSYVSSIDAPVDGSGCAMLGHGDWAYKNAAKSKLRRELHACERDQVLQYRGLT